VLISSPDSLYGVNFKGYDVDYDIKRFYYGPLLIAVGCTFNGKEKSKCKTNMIPISMHQMRISTYQVLSVVLRPKKLKYKKL
jgi:hypothetical protein